VKLRGRTQTPDWSRGCRMLFRTRGNTTDSHGLLQRLLGVGSRKQLAELVLNNGRTKLSLIGQGS